MIIKVSGMCHADNMREVSALDVDMIGLVFNQRSPRNVGMRSSQAGILPDYCQAGMLATPNTDKEQAAAMRERPARVGIFADDMPQTIVSRVYAFKLGYVQLHGDESHVMIENLRRTLVPDIVPDIKVIKTVRLGAAADLAQCSAYEDVVDMFVFEGLGGEVVDHRPFDWTLLDAYRGHVPFLVSGGIGVDDAARVRKIAHPQFAGVDVGVCFETKPGMIDTASLRRFIEDVRA